MIRVGTSGYNYPAWRGSFYPARLPAARMLPFYAERFATVEINYTFYRMPTPAVTGGWARATPDGFVFALKAPRRITHIRRPGDGAEPVARFLAAAAGLRPKLGPVLFQLPATFRKATDRFAALLEAAAAFVDFKHEATAAGPALAARLLARLAPAPDRAR